MVSNPTVIIIIFKTKMSLNFYQCNDNKAPEEGIEPAPVT
jgi:hypothetical protein